MADMLALPISDLEQGDFCISADVQQHQLDILNQCLSVFLILKEVK